MLVEFVKIVDLSTRNVCFYTVRVNKHQLTEFEKFDDKDFPDHHVELTILYNIITELGLRGAKPRYFKFEASAEALPIVSSTIMASNKKDFGLRLYCKLLTESLVILLNGDIKTLLDTKSCPRVKQHFNFALKLGTALNKLIQQKELNLKDSDPLSDLEIEL